MTEKELAREISDRLKVSVRIAEEIVKLMDHAARTARVSVDLSTSGKVYTTHLVPGLPG